MGPLDHINLTLVDSVEKAESFMRWLGERRGILGVDTETTGLSAYRHDLRLVQFGDLDNGWAIPWHLWGGVAVQALKRYDGPLVLHNSKFDVGFITRHAGWSKWPWHRTHDTLTMSHLTHPKLPHGLKALSALLVDAKAVATQRLLDERMTEHHWNWATVPIDFEPYWLYAAMDPVLTCHLYERLSPALESYQGVYDLEIGVLAVTWAIERHGALIDRDYCTATRGNLNSYAEAARGWCTNEFRIANVGSTRECIEVLEGMGCLINRSTPGGAKSLDKYQLQLIAYEGREPAATLARTILSIRKAEKNIGPYFDNFLTLADAQDRLHASIWTLGTRTARMSVTEPAMQTIPKKDGLVRNAFVPGPGSVLITCDFEQIEMRLLAHFSQDEGLAQAFREADRTGGDFFLQLAWQIYGDSTIVKKDHRRQLTKNTLYGKAYGAGVSKMAETAGVPYDVMEPVVKAFDGRFPGVREFQSRVEQVGLQRLHAEGEPYIITPYGRRMPADEDKVYVLVNYLIQCHAAEIFKRKILELDAVGLGNYMVLPVHDEIVLEVPKDQAEEAKDVIEATMSNLTDYAVPLTAHAVIIRERWGEKYADA